MMNFNLQNPKNLQNIYSVNPRNESNIPLNPTTYNTIKKQISINSEFRKKTLVSLDNIIESQMVKCCKNLPNPSLESSTNFTVDLYEPIDNVTSLELVNTEIPNINPTFSLKKNNNKFIINIHSRGNEFDTEKKLRSYLIKIPDGLWPASSISNYLKNNYFNYKPAKGSQIQNHLGYLKFDFELSSGKSIFRFKNSSELSSYRSNDISGLLPFSNISNEGFYFEVLNCDNFNYQNYNFENIRDDSCNKLPITNASEYCKNNINKFAQGFGNPHINNYMDNFKFTTLGTFGFEFNDIYDLSGDNMMVTSKKNEFDTKHDAVTPIGEQIYYGFLKSTFTYGQFASSAYYIRVNDFVGNRGEQIIIQGENQSQITNNVLAIIPIREGPFSTNITSASSDYSIKRNYFGGVKISKLQIQILDKYGMILDFNDFPTNFVFEFTQEYSSENLSNFRNRM